MKRSSVTRIDEIYNAICDIFLQYDVTEQEVNKIIKQAGIEYILSLKKRHQGVEQETADKR